jgi:hypothetical protein
VTNTGNAALSDVNVTDDQAGVAPAYVSGDTSRTTIRSSGPISIRLRLRPCRVKFSCSTERTWAWSTGPT